MISKRLEPGGRGMATGGAVKPQPMSGGGTPRPPKPEKKS